jgi:predicted O-methyltransferase YrrM
MNTLHYILDKYVDNFVGTLPTEISDVSRYSLALWLHELDFKIGVEVGVASGQYSRVLCNYNPQMKVYGVDPWIPYPEYTDYVLKSTFKTLKQDAMNRLLKKPNFEFIEKMSMDAVKQFKDESLDFVYIDANHENPFVYQDIVEWGKKIRSGGIISGHDFTKPHNTKCDVIEAVTTYTKENNINPWFVLGAKEKKSGIVRESIRSWMIIKP